MPIKSETHRPPSAEGDGVARARRANFVDGLPDDLVDAFDLQVGRSNRVLRDLPADVQKQVSSEAKEYSEMIGFWVVWHLAGGFSELERWGWHRATIYRKLKRFEKQFGSHPDKHDFEWITLDLDKAWWADISAMTSEGQ